MRIPRPISLWSVFVLMMSGVGSPVSAQAPSLMERIERRLEAVRSELIAIRRDIHQHPEVSGQEQRTAGVVANRLRGLGLEVHTGIGGHGVVGILRGAEPGPVVAFRADMDAVPSRSLDPVPFASVNQGVRHICGHDIHTTVGLALAEVLAAVREELGGTVVFIFQPGEEDLSGARAMIRDGVLDDPAPEAIFAFHSAPLEVGQIGSNDGLLLPGLDRIRLTLRGEGDLEVAARAYTRAVSSVSTGQDVTPAEFVQAMIGHPESGPESRGAVLTGMVRAGSPDARARAKREIEQAVATVEVESVGHELEYEDLFLPDVVNDSTLVRAALGPLRSAVGPDGVLELNQVTPYFGEDFAYYMQHIPGAMYWLGVSNSELGNVGMPHSPEFVADEEAIFIGAKAMAAVLIDFLARH